MELEIKEMPGASKYPGVDTDATELGVPLAAIAPEKGPGSRFHISVPWSPQVYFTVRGAENFHIYLWILKDLAWSQSWTNLAWFFGLSAIAWCLVLVYHAVDAGCFLELYMLVVTILWLSANFVWMAGEVFHNDDDTMRPEASTIMIAGLSLMCLYHLVLKPFKLLPMDTAMTVKYNEAGLYPRFSYFENWREYEHAHMLCWLGKDLAWNIENPVLWIMCLIPTFFIGLDFIWVTAKTKRMTIDVAHYVAQVFWVSGNAVWAVGEVFTVAGNDDDRAPYSMWHASDEAKTKLRWWSSVILFIALVPIFCLYLVWLPLTVVGAIKAADIPENDLLGEQATEPAHIIEQTTNAIAHGQNDLQNQA